MPSKKQRREWSQKYMDKRRRLLHSIKDVPCEDCGQKYPPWVMDFHHRDKTVKSFDIGTNALQIGLQRLLDEIEKCALLCANCHRDREYRERNDW